MKRLIVALVAACGLVLALAPGALAWKPFMHNYTGDRAWEDVVDDGHVTINGRSYDVPQAVEDALRNQKPYFNAGVVGPDGFPDLVFGQSIIHSEETGKWVQHILARAWAAQTDGSYNATQKQQILAFAFGYATHAAGDMWAHTFINDHALGVFPAVGEILTDVDDAEIALRHLIAEGYVGDATPGYDGNPDRTPVPFEVNEDGDQEYSDNASPRIPYAVPNRFVYDTLVNPNNPLPVGTCGNGVDDDGDGFADDGCPGQHYTVGDPEPRRGKLIDFFLDLQAEPAAAGGPLGVGLRVHGLRDRRPGLLLADEGADGAHRPGGHDDDGRLPELRGRDDRLRRLAGRHRRGRDQRHRRDVRRALDRGHRGRPGAVAAARPRLDEGSLRPGHAPRCRQRDLPQQDGGDDAAAGRLRGRASGSSTCSSSRPRTTSKTTSSRWPAHRTRPVTCSMRSATSATSSRTCSGR